MSDDLIEQLSYFIINEVRMPAGLTCTVINEIERLREMNGNLTRRVNEVQRQSYIKDDNLARIAADAYADFERLWDMRVERDALQAKLDAIDAAVKAWPPRHDLVPTIARILHPSSEGDTPT